MEKYVSVVIPTFNRENFIEQAVSSVFAQSHPFFEVIVVDDGSTDRTPEIIASLRQRDARNRLVTIRQENRGAAAARNTGIRAARHELIAFVDSDDRFNSDKLAVQVAAMEENPSSLVSHTEEIWYRRGRRHNPKVKHGKTGGDIFARSLPLCVVGMSTVMVRQELFSRVGLFDEDFICCEDYDLWLRAAVETHFLFINQPLTIKDGGREDQLSVIHRMGMDKWRIRSIVKLLEQSRMNPGQRDLAVAELNRKCTIYGNGCIKHGRKEEGLYYLGLARKYCHLE